jgi:putative transcription factor
MKYFGRVDILTESKNACDICGRRIVGKPQFRFFEGARLMVCDICARFAEKSQPPSPSPQQESVPAKKYIPSPRKRSQKKSTENMELREDYAKIIREAREQKGWTQTELSKQLMERLSTVRHIEAGKMQPPEALIEKFQNVLGISLRASTSDIPEIKIESKLPDDMTLGDVVHLKSKKKKSEE